MTMDALPPNSVQQAPSEAQPEFIPYAQAKNAGVGAEWISSAWRLFRGKTGMWIALMILALLGSMLLGLVPLGEYIQFLLTPILMGGLMLLCDHQYRSGTFDLGLVFRPFKTHLWPLLGLALVQALYWLVVAVALYGLLGWFFGFDVLAAIVREEGMVNLTEHVGSVGARFGFFSLLVLGVFVSILVYYGFIWFSPGLIVLHDVPLLRALSMSLAAVKKNLLPGLVFYLLLSLLSLAFMIPLMMTVLFVPLFFLLALIMTLVLGPLVLIAMYTSYRCLFLREV